MGYENRLLANEDFNNDAKDAGELGAGHSVTVLYEVVPVGASSGTSGSVDPLRYGASGTNRRPQRAERGNPSDEMMFVKLRYKAPDGDRSTLITHAVRADDMDGSSDLRFAAAVAGFGMLLRNSDHAGDLQLSDVTRLAEAGLGTDEKGYRSEFIRLVERARTLELLESDPQ
ncbi:MAG: Ca-activated chloride channel family protein [Myxococcota bacterium]